MQNRGSRSVFLNISERHGVKKIVANETFDDGVSLGERVPQTEFDIGAVTPKADGTAENFRRNDGSPVSQRVSVRMQGVTPHC